MSINQRVKKMLAPVFAARFKGKGHILMLHRIVPKSDDLRVHNTVNEITPEKLEELIVFYKKQNIQIISLDQIEDFTKNKNDYFVVFTFDDGYLDNLTEALPVFEKHNVPFTVYVTTGFPNRSISIWWYQLEEILLKNQSILFNWGGVKHEFLCKSHDQKEEVFNSIRRIVIDTPFVEQRENLNNAFDQYVDDPYAITSKLAMSWDDLVIFSKSPLVTIGAHTLNHTALNQLTEEEVISECLKSKEELESRIMKSVTHFSYPFGSAKEVGAREFKIVSDIGFKTATTTRQGSIFSEHRDHFYALPRIPITQNTSLDYLKSIANGKENFIRGARHRVTTL